MPDTIPGIGIQVNIKKQVISANGKCYKENKPEECIEWVVVERWGDEWSRGNMCGDVGRLRRCGGVAPEALLSPPELFCSGNRE